MPYNAFYENCKHFEWRYQKSTYIGNSHSKVIAYCKKYLSNVYDFVRKDDIPMCCISHSPYTLKNCIFFEDKNNQKQLTDFIGGNNE